MNLKTFGVTEVSQKCRVTEFVKKMVKVWSKRCEKVVKKTVKKVVKKLFKSCQRCNNVKTSPTTTYIILACLR
jgi:hypothetical protein